jgi:hypothetical protein
MKVRIMESKKILFSTAIILFLITFLIISCNTDNSKNNSIKNRTIDHIPSQESIDTLKIILDDLGQQLGLAIIAATPPRKPPDLFSIQENQKAIEQIKKELAFLESLTCAHTLEELKTKLKYFNKSSTQKNADQLMILLNQFIIELETQTNTVFWKELVPTNNSQELSKVCAKLNTHINNL